MVEKNIPVIREPPLKEILRVNQRGFGYINPEVDRSYIETISLGKCVGVYVRDVNRQLQALAHIDDANYLGHHLGYRNQTHNFLEYLKYGQRTNEIFDSVLVLRSEQADKKGIDEIYSTLKMRGHRGTEIIDGGHSIKVIFDKNGNMYWLDPETIKAEERSDDEWKLFGLEIMTRDGLKCENTGKIVGRAVSHPKYYTEKILDGKTFTFGGHPY